MSFKRAGNSLSCHSLSTQGMGHDTVTRLADAARRTLDQLTVWLSPSWTLSPPRFLQNTRLKPREPWGLGGKRGGQEDRGLTRPPSLGRFPRRLDPKHILPSQLEATNRVGAPEPPSLKFLCAIFLFMLQQHGHSTTCP